MKWLSMFLFLCVFLSVPCITSAAQQRIYLAPDDHTDYMWTGDEAQYKQAFVGTLDYYLNQIDATAADASDYQARWNCDGWLWMWTYQHEKSAGDFNRLINAIATGHISVPLNCLVPAYGGAPLEDVIRGSFYPGRIERQFSIRFPMAVSMENQGIPYGLVSIWSGCGAKYSWKGICNCATRVPDAGNREHDIYWWTGPDGARMLMKWNTLFGSNRSIGGYAEARDPDAAISFASTNSTFKAHYPFDVIGIFGYGWDDLQTQLSIFPSKAKANTTANCKVRVSNEQDFFADFEPNYGAQIPEESCSFGNEWELYSASMAETSASVKRSTEQLRGAEAVASFVTLSLPNFMQGFETARDAAWVAMGKYWDHSWTADSAAISRSERAAWERQLAATIKAYPDLLQSQATSTLGGLIINPGYSRCYYVFNPLSWARTDYADLPLAAPAAFHVIDVASGQDVPAQSVQNGAAIRILATGVPATGFKLFAVLDGTGQRFFNAATISGSVMTNDKYQVNVAARGAIQSLVDLRNNNREYVQSVNGYCLNDLGPASGTISVQEQGPVSTTLVATSSQPLAHTSAITLFRDVDRIEIRNDINENFSNLRMWNFEFNLANAICHHEEIGAVVRAALLADGGQYSPRNARYDYLSLNHFADLSTSSAGMTLSNADCSFMRLGQSTISSLDTQTPSLAVLAGGQVDGSNLGIPNQGGETHFLQRFALRAHGAYSPAESMRFALEHQNPLIASRVTGGTAFRGPVRSLLSISNPQVALWSMKPAEDGANAGLVLRFWNLTSSPQQAIIAFPDYLVASAQSVTHIETPTGTIAPLGQALALSFAPQQIRSIQVKLAAQNSALHWWKY